MTINSQEEFTQALSAMRLLYDGLAILRREATGAEFQILAEGPMDEVTRIQGEVAKYLEMTPASSVWLRLIGDRVSQRETPASVLTWAVDTFRKGVQSLVEYDTSGRLSTRPTKAVKQAADFRLAHVLDGSVQLGLNIPPDSQLGLPGHSSLETKVVEAVSSIIDVAEWASAEAPLEELESRIPNPDRRRLLLTHVAQMAPRKRGALTAVEIASPAAKRTAVRLTQEARDRVRAGLSTLPGNRPVRVRGVLREIDLDKQSFVLRRSGVRDVACAFPEALLDVAKEALDKPVVVAGSRPPGARRRDTSLKVEWLEILEDDSDPEDEG